MARKAPPPPALSGAVRQFGRPLVTSLTFAIKTSRLYSFSHSNVKAALADLASNLGELARAAGAGVKVMGHDECLYVNEVRMKPDFSSAQSFQFVLDLLRQNEIAEIAFQPEVAVEELAALVQMLSSHRPDPEQPWQSFAEALARTRMPHIAFARTGERSVSFFEDQGGRVLTMGIYFKTISYLESVLEASREKKPLFLKKLKHSIQAIVDITWGGEHLLLALSNVKGHGAPGANHGINVAILAVALGKKLGFPRRFLGELGMAAALHDIGKAGLPDHLRALGCRDVPAADAPLYATHTFAGMEALLTEHVAESSVRSINVALLHHYRFDRTGMPKLLSAQEQDLFTRIVAVADFYENATAPSPSRPALSAEAAMRTLLDGSGTEFDPLVVKGFINLMGLYPVGCLVRLDTREVATVAAPPQHARFLDRPTVRVIADPAGAPVDFLADLMERDAAGAFRRSILKLYQNEEVKLELEEYLTVL